MKSCFVIQPFNEKFNKRYEDTFSPAIKRAGLDPYRVDQDDTSKIPIQDIERRIADSDIAFADITTDNPNVWYEIGFAYACQKDVVLVCCNEERTGPFPFDVRHKNILTYSSTSKRDFEDLENKIVTRLDAYMKDAGRLAPKSAPVPPALQKYLDDFPAFATLPNLQREFVKTSRESFFSALKCVLEDLDEGDVVVSTDSVNLSRQCNYVQYWAKEGLPYLKLNFEAFKRGIRFTRIFILDEHEFEKYYDYVLLLARLHRTAGIDAKYVKYQELLRTPTYLREFAVFGEKYVDETIYDVRSHSVIDNFIHWSRDVHSGFSQMSKVIISLADDFQGLDEIEPATDILELTTIAKLISEETAKIV